DYGGESSYQPGYRLENMMWMTLLVYDYIIPGEKYNYTSEKIDSIISAYEDRIKEYIAYLRKMYLEEESLLMKVTDEIKEECSGYAEFLGLDYSEGEDIFDKFITDNKIREKSGILMALLTYYGDTGKFEEVKSNAGDIVMDSFKKKEYIRLMNAVEQLLNLQKELHKKSGSIYLSQDDEKEMVTKACMIGFQTDDGCIAEVIRGNEIKLGYSLKQEIAIRNKLIEENKNKLSRIASSKAVILLGEKYEFGSCYFVKNEIEQFYRKELTDLKQRTMLMMKRYDVSNVGGGIKFIDAIGPMLIQWGDIIEKYNSLANVSQKILEEEIKSLCTTSECDHAFLTDLQEQWEREDKNRRTIQGIEYETREEASEAGVELKKIEKLYEGYKKSYTQKYLSLIGGIEINVMNDAVMFVQCTGSDGTVAEWDMDLKPTEIGDDGEYIYYYGKGIKMSYYPSDHHIHVDGENNYFGDYYPNDNEIGLQNCGSCRERQLFSFV
ncbi:MAG: hypothetical protein E6529_12760, partial [[Ruminococcus] lactaris]|nr:hypothetical protein [[Ruminococcus] lactaris]